MGTIFRWVVQLAGYGLVGVAWLSREWEEQRIEGFVARLWVRVRELQRQGVSAQAALLRVVADLTGRAMKWAIGEKLLSLRAAWTSGATSLASLFLLYGFLFLYSPKGKAVTAQSAGDARNAMIVMFAAGGIFFGVALLPKIHRWAASVLWAAFLIWFSWVLYVLRFWESEAGTYFLACLCALIVGGILCDLAVLAVFRRVLLWVEGLRSWPRMAFGLGVLSLLVAGAVMGPGSAALQFLRATETHGKASLVDNTTRMAQGLLVAKLIIPSLIGLSNLLTAAFVVVYIVVLAIAVAHRAAIVMLERPLYALTRHGIFQNRKIIFSLGLVLIGVGQRPVADFLYRAIK